MHVLRMYTSHMSQVQRLSLSLSLSLICMYMIAMSHTHINSVEHTHSPTRWHCNTRYQAETVCPPPHFEDCRPSRQMALLLRAARPLRPHYHSKTRDPRPPASCRTLYQTYPSWQARSNQPLAVQYTNLNHLPFVGHFTKATSCDKPDQNETL